MRTGELLRHGVSAYTGGGGEGGTSVHNILTGREAESCHPQSAISGLESALDDRYTKAEVDAKFSGIYSFKGTVNTVADLPASNNTNGDVWNVLENDVNYAWDNTKWDALGGSIDLSAYMTAAQTNAALELKVNKEDGKSLISDSEIARLAGVTSYDDTEIQAKVEENTTAIQNKVNTSDLATVATSGEYADLQNTPEIPSVPAWALEENKPTYTKDEIGLANVDNTTDMEKPVSTAQQSALDLKQNELTAGDNITISNNVISVELPDNIVSTVNGRSGEVILTKADVALENVDNTTDAEKPVSTAQQTALDLKQDVLIAGDNIVISGNTISATTGGQVTVSSVNGQTGSVVLDKADIGLANVDNTSDTDKPVSTAMQAALDGKMNNVALATVATSGDYNDLENLPAIPSIVGLATTTYVDDEIATKQDTLSVAQLANINATYASVATSGDYADLTGTPTIPSIDGLATITYVDSEISALVDSAPETLNTLKELADAIQEEETALDGLVTTVGNKADTTYVNTELGKKQDSLTAAQLANVNATYATVATSGAYSDLTGTPVIPSIDGLATTEAVNAGLALKANSADLAEVATSGSYSDLTGTPIIPSIDGLATVEALNTGLATKQDSLTQGQLDNIADVVNKVDIVGGKGLSTEDYTTAEKTKLASLSNFDDTTVYATIATEAETRNAADIAISDSVATKQDILVSGTNIKTIGGESVLGEGNIICSYPALENKPTLNGVEINGAKTAADYNIVMPTVPTTVSSFTNDSGYITNTVTDLVNYYDKPAVNGLINNLTIFKYKTVTELPTTDISESTCYLLLVADGVYEQNMYIENVWTQLGTTALDLTDYAKSADVDTALASKVDVQAGKSLVADAEITKLESLENYDDTAILAALDGKVNKETTYDVLSADLVDNAVYEVTLATDTTITSATGQGYIVATVTADCSFIIPGGELWAHGQNSGLTANTIVEIMYRNGRWSKLTWSV